MKILNATEPAVNFTIFACCHSQARMQNNLKSWCGYDHEQRKLQERLASFA